MPSGVSNNVILVHTYPEHSNVERLILMFSTEYFEHIFPYGICGGHGDTGTGYSTTFVSYVISIPPVPEFHISFNMAATLVSVTVESIVK